MPDENNSGGVVIKLTDDGDTGISAPEVIPPTYLEIAGTKQMVGLLIVIGTSAVLLLISWWFTQPTLDEAYNVLHLKEMPAQTMDAGQVIDLWVKLQNAHTEQLTKVFQTVVLSGLVPLFTLLAGYVFGRGASGTEVKEKNDG